MLLTDVIRLAKRAFVPSLACVVACGPGPDSVGLEEDSLSQTREIAPGVFRVGHQILNALDKGSGVISLFNSDTLAVGVGIFSILEGPDGCRASTVDACRIEECPVPPTPREMVSAGEVTIRSLDPRGEPIGTPLLTIPGGVFPASVAIHPGPIAARVLGVRAAGALAEGGFPPFFGLNRMPSARVKLLTPEISLAQLAGAEPVVVDRSTPISLTWERTQARSFGKFEVQINGTSAQGSVFMECEFDPEAGQGTVPAAALARFDAGQGDLQIVMEVRTHYPLFAGGDGDVDWIGRLSVRNHQGAEIMGALNAVIE